ncbi:MAG: UDP-N-acetylmuramate dehydrogenase [Defluviitaleaceae bacterium]|nr:UDP-N-acetylmuramate dehydrogenase [Defluviitaleaceae bacterium]
MTLFDEPMSRYTTFGIGGAADILVFPEATDDFLKILKICERNNLPLTALGDGSNVLVSDEGIRGVVVITNKMNDVEILENNRIRAQAGTRLSKLADAAVTAGLDGLAFASGIPGTVGGAIYMNAGAYGHDIGEFIESVTLLMPDGAIVSKSAAEMGFGYRKSILADGSAMFVIEAVFKLRPGDPEKTRREMKDLNARRKESQPLEYRSAGSTFKRPEGHFAGKLIEDSGLKGFGIGGAEVSEKHAGFIINKGGATAKDVLELIEAIRQKVHQNFGVWLEPEVRVIGGHKCVL